MKISSHPMRTVTCLFAILAIHCFTSLQSIKAEDAVQEPKNPLLAELAEAQFIECTADEMKEDLDGKLVGLYFTASWCGPCRSFTPKLIKLRDANPDDFQFVMVSHDDKIEAQKGYLNKTKMGVPALRFDDPLSQEFSQRHGANAIPMLVVSDSGGELLTRFGQECMTQTLRPGALEPLGKSEDGKTFQKLMAPYQKELQAERQELVKDIPSVVEKYKDFPHIEEIASWIGYLGGGYSIEEIMHKTGKEIVADWDNQKQHLEYLSELAIALKPQTNGYRGVLEVNSDALFEELGKASAKNPEILALLNRFASGDSVNPRVVGNCKKWGMIGLVMAAVEGDDQAMKKVIGWRDLRISHAPLQIYPSLYSACREGNSRALDMAKQIYEDDPYYVYKAIAAFVPAALDGNATAIEALGLVAVGGDKHGYDKHVLRFLKEAAAKGHDKAQEVLDNLSSSEEATNSDQVESSPKNSQAAKEVGDKFGAQLQADCYVLANGKLTSIPKYSFSKTKLYRVLTKRDPCAGRLLGQCMIASGS